MKEKLEKIYAERKKLAKQEQDLMKEFKEWVKDKSISLDERWSLFMESNLGDNKPYIEHFKSVPEDAMGYEADINLERRENVDMNYILESILEAKAEIEEDPNYKYARTKIASIDIDSFKEEVLEKFIKSFNYDW